ncbi:cation:proton antiporter [candidate division KSB1 bacterium]|nr:cation:proton antiporter [candidate division KSB1 bacterium]
MNNGPSDISLLIMLMGGCLVAVIFIRSLSSKISLPSIVGYLVLGVLIRVSDNYLPLLTEEAWQIFEFLAQIGIFTLLFRIGLESDLAGLIKQIRSASWIWFCGVALSSVLGFVGAYYLLQLELIQSLFIAIAMTATSVGIPVSVWNEANALKSRRGELLLDVAEMDDISGVVFMALLFSIVPVLRTQSGASLIPILSKNIVLISLKLITFGALCWFFSRYIEENITSFFKDIDSSPDPMLVVTGIGIIIAAGAGMLGFSIAIGAFFAGIVFSRDPNAVKLDASFETLYDFFSPFFFIVIGLKIEPGSFGGALGTGVILLIIAILGKMIGHGVPAYFADNKIGFLLIGFSMIPRAEITMVILERGKALGDWAVSSKIFTAMVLVSTATCILSPIIIRKLLNRWHQNTEE